MGEINDGDDFGDLYADIEGLANSVINDDKLNIDDMNDNNDDVDQKCDMNEDFVADSKKFGCLSDECETPGPESNGSEELEEKLILSEGSDSDDDLNIVLNDDDFRIDGGSRNLGFVGGGYDGGGFNVDEFVSATKENGLGLDENHGDNFVRRSGKAGDDSGSVRRGNCPSQISQYKDITHRDYTSAFQSTAGGRRSAGAIGDWKLKENWNEHRWTRNRAMLNANVDLYDQKPWRNSGVDVTDFFNFGFDEKSWKDYYSSMQLCQQASVNTKIPAYTYLNCHQAYRAEHDYEMSEDAMADVSALGGHKRIHKPDEFNAIGGKYLKLPRGRAIEVEGSAGERQSSMDVKHPRVLNSDVVIQITGQDTRAEYSGSDKELDQKISASHEASDNLDFGKDDKGETRSTDFLEGSLRSSVRHSTALRSCSENGQFSDLEGKDHKKLKYPEEKGGALESDNKENETKHKSLREKESCVIETESSSEGHVKLSPSMSCFGSRSEASEDDVYIGPKKTQKPFKKSSLNLAGYNVGRDSDSNNLRGKKASSEVSSRRIKSPIRERPTLYLKRPRYKEVLYAKDHSHVFRDREHDKDIICAKDHSRVFRGIEHESQGGLGPHQKEINSFYKKKYNRERLANDHFRDCNSNRSYGKHRPGFGNDTDPYFKRTCSEREYFADRRIYMGRDWDHLNRGFVTKDTDCLMHRDRQRDSEYSFNSHGEKYTRWTSDGRYLNNRNDDGDPWHDYGHDDDFKMGKNRRDIPFIDRECDYLEESRLKKNDRRLPLNTDYPWFQGKQNNSRRHVDNHIVSSRFNRESHTMASEKWSDTRSHRYDVDDLRLIDVHGRSRRETYDERLKDGQRRVSYDDAVDGHSGNNGYYKQSDEFNLLEDELPFRRKDEEFYDQGMLFSNKNISRHERRYYKQSKPSNFAEDELPSRHKDEKLYDEHISFSNKKVSRHKSLLTTKISALDRIVNNDKLERHIYGMIREGNGGQMLNRNCKPISDEREQTILSCKDSVDSVVGEGKSPKRCTEAETILYNDLLENMNSERYVEHTTSMELSKCQIEKAETGNNEEIEEWHDKFTVSKQDDALDLEEGQIVTDDQNMNFPMKEICSLKKACNVNEFIEGIEQDRILQSLAKMEKRRERFKQPLITKKELDMNLESRGDSEMRKGKQRPTRKRLWDGNCA